VAQQCNTDAQYGVSLFYVGAVRQPGSSHNLLLADACQRTGRRSSCGTAESGRHQHDQGAYYPGPVTFNSGQAGYSGRPGENAITVLSSSNSRLGSTGSMYIPVPYCLLALLLFLPGCTGIPDGVSPITGFDVNRYLGTWYEIARLDHSFERDLEQVTAEYSLRDDGGIRVLNKGYNSVKQRWEQAEGKAYFTGDSKVGRLKVSFFGPFYGGYNIIDLDHEDYQYALVSGPNTSYLWILARQPVLDAAIVRQLLAKASRYGFDTSRMIFVAQQASAQPPIN
jgi:apolipoprotein D and lipocalin family protein